MLDITQLPNHPGVYFFKDKSGNILYIGKAKDLKKRVAHYFSPNSLRKQDMLTKSQSIDFVTVTSEVEALELEDNLIKKHKPIYNSLLKGNNSYVYIKIPNEAFPEIFITKQRRNDKATYIGPKYQSQELKKLLQYLRQILQYRSCKAKEFKKGKLCSYYHFGLCKGRCKKPFPSPLIKGDKRGICGSPQEQYKKLIQVIKDFFKGKTESIKERIKEEIQESAKVLNFERAAKLRDIYLKIEELTENQSVILDPKLTGHIVKIKKIGESFIYVILYFFEGKLIDIIRGHKDEIDDEAALIASLHVEFGNIQTTKQASGEIFGHSENLKITASIKTDLDTLIERIFEGYIAKNTIEQKTGGSSENFMNTILADLQKNYHLKHFPYHIECIDISHLSGGRTSGGLSCMISGLRYPKGYRRYKIASSSDDYNSLKEVLKRRFATQDFLPNLLIIDGGHGQLNVIQKIIKESKKLKELFEKLDIISIGKGKARKRSSRSAGEKEKVYFFDTNGQIQDKEIEYKQFDKIILEARNESHRFANNYRKKQMSMERKTP